MDKDLRSTREQIQEQRQPQTFTGTGTCVVSKQQKKKPRILSLQGDANYSHFTLVRVATGQD